MICWTVSLAFQSFSVSVSAANWKLELKLIRSPYRSLARARSTKLIYSDLPSTIASWARLIALNLEFDIFAVVEIFETAFEAMRDILNR